MAENRLPWEGSRTHSVFAVIMVLGCLMIAVGFVAPFIAQPQQVAGYQIFNGAFKAMKKLVEILSGKQGKSLVDSDLGKVILEVMLILIINGICFGLLAIASVYSVVKYVVAKRSALTAFTVPVFLSFLTLGYVVLRLGQADEGDRTFALFFMDALSMGARRSGDVLEFGVGAYLYPFGMLLGLIGTNVMYRVERKARKLQKSRTKEASEAQPPPAPVPVETADPLRTPTEQSGPAPTARESVPLGPAPTAPAVAAEPLRPGFWTRKAQLIVLGVLVVVVVVAGAVVLSGLSKKSEVPGKPAEQKKPVKKESAKAEAAEREEEGLEPTFEMDEDEGIPPPEEFEEAAAEEAKPPEGVKPAEEAKPPESTKPAEEAKPPESMKPAEEAAPPEGVKPAEEAAPSVEPEGEGEEWQVFRAHLDKKDPFLNLRNRPGGDLVGKLTDRDPGGQ